MLGVDNIPHRYLLKMCQKLDLRSLYQDQGHSCTCNTLKVIFLDVRAITSYYYWIRTTFHTIVVHDSRVWHDLGQRSYLQGQGYRAYIAKTCVQVITFTDSWIWMVHEPRVFHDLDTNHIYKVKVTMHT